jgi:ssDNA-binding Zn-finger/Zn-ribbon topoisomerase 1
MICPVCNVEMIRKASKFRNGFWWGCSNYPRCKITMAEHPDGTAMSTPADQETKELRIKAHELCAKWFGEWESKKCDKKGMYEFLKHNTKSGHIGKMDKAELVGLIDKLQKGKQP